MVLEGKKVGFREAFLFWVKLGFINFGGPAGQISLMHRELVERKRWISEHRFLQALNLCMLLPGPEAQQLATYIGWRLHGTLGGLVAGAFFVIPSIFVLLLLSFLAVAYSDVPAVTGLLYGVGPVVVAVVLEAVLRIGRRTLNHPALVSFAVAAFVAIFFLSFPFPSSWPPPSPGSSCTGGTRACSVPAATALPRMRARKMMRRGTCLRCCGL